jgi:hypothetical protein
MIRANYRGYLLHLGQIQYRLPTLKPGTEHRWRALAREMSKGSGG